MRECGAARAKKRREHGIFKSSFINANGSLYVAFKRLFASPELYTCIRDSCTRTNLYSPVISLAFRLAKASLSPLQSVARALSPRYHISNYALQCVQLIM